MFIWATSGRKFNLWRGKCRSGGFVIAFAKAPSPSHLATYPATSADPTTPATKAPTAMSTPASPTCPTSTLDSPRAVNHHRCPNPAAPGLSTSTTPSAPVDPDPTTSTSSQHHPTVPTGYHHHLDRTTTSPSGRRLPRKPPSPLSLPQLSPGWAEDKCPLFTTPPTVLSRHQPPLCPPHLNAATPAAPSSPQRRHHIPMLLHHPGRATTPAIATPTTATTSVAPEPSGYYHH
ncbi:hypothetical protein EDB89DRAFT_1917578 [Lactarius sanguifluus]|nr:hypothetical protein EDB89DRAFT_1917578 [Lactarius sanguifluus]